MLPVLWRGGKKEEEEKEEADTRIANPNLQ